MDTQKIRTSVQLPIDQSPFSESAATESFFSGSRRREILDGMASALANGIPIVTLTGDEGSGKTVLCRLLMERMDPDCGMVYFPQTVDSFEDVLKAIVQELEMAIDPAPKNRTELLQGIVSHLHHNDQRVVLIFDEAERIYLATLERVRKMLDLANDDGIFIQMVMSGRSSLHHNFRNLALVNFQPAEERHFSLEPLTEDETCEYLNSAMVGQVQDNMPVFNREAATAIFAASRGNLRMINQLADEVFKDGEARNRTNPTVVGGEQKEKAKQDRPRRRLKRPAVVIPKITLNRRYLTWGGGAACIVLAFLLFWPKEKAVGPHVEVVPDTETSIVISEPKEMERAEPDVAAIEQNDQGSPEAKETSASQIKGKIQRQQGASPTPAPTIAEPVVVSVPQEPRPPAAEAEPEAEEKRQPNAQQAVPASGTSELEKAAASVPVEPVVVSIPQQPQPPVTVAESETEEKNQLTASTGEISEQRVEKEKVPPPPPVEDKQRTETALEAAVEEPAPADPASQNPPTGREVAVVAETSRPVAVTEIAPILPQTIKASPVLKHREDTALSVRETITSQPVKILKQEEPDAFDMPATPVTIRAVEQKKEAPQEAPPADTARGDAPATAKPRKIESADRIYSSRVAAGASWFSGLKDDRYTVRLMVITSGNAEKKLKKMLGEQNYREQADKFYILRRESNPGVQYVYYGEYPTMTAARNARNTIPEFLRGYKPYAMSVKGAVQRAQQED